MNPDLKLSNDVRVLSKLRCVRKVIEDFANPKRALRNGPVPSSVAFEHGSLRFYDEGAALIGQVDLDGRLEMKP